jgi:prevent-host-death family protein
MNTTPIKIIALSEAKNRLGKLLTEIKRKDERYTITRRGKEIAVVLGIDDFEDLMEQTDIVFQETLRKARAEYETEDVVGLDRLHKTHQKANGLEKN